MKSLRWSAACAAALIALGAAAAPLPRPAMPLLHLGEHGLSGQRAIDVLGPALPAVAAHYRKTPQALREALLSDATLRLDVQGRLFYLDTHTPPPKPTMAATGQPAQAASALPLEQTFTLHSRPGAARTLFLDFDGAVISGTAWNSGGGPRYAQPFDADGNLGAFSDAELARIQAIWQRVAEDYAPFDVDVTTQQPAPDALTRSSLGDELFGTTVVVTDSNGVYDCQCGGVAYVGVFDAVGDYYKPALVFWNQLSSDEKYVAEAISHEAGHNLGLSHDGYSGGGYYPGHGDGATGWAPIMGVGYYKTVVQWSQGEYNTANNTEDDFAVMEANGGPLRADDHGDSRPSASALAVSPTGSLSGSGVIERVEDIDFFYFEAGAGEATFNVRFPSPSPNLDVRMDVRKANGERLVKVNPKSALRASASVTLPEAGRYYLTIEGVGKGLPPYTAHNGYSDYGSRGEYAISGAVPPR